MNKKEIRKHMLLVRRDMSSEDVESASEAVYKNLMLLDEYKACSRIYVYLDYNHEVKTDKIIKKALLDGKEVYVPRIDGDVMNFYKFTSFDDVSEGYKGIPEPSKESVIDNERRGLLLMPLLAWDKHFNRVGYGKGFYDQYISRKHGDFLRIGLAFKTQYVDEIEDSAMTDMPMHMVITDEKIFISVGDWSPTEINAPRGCARIRKGNLSACADRIRRASLAVRDLNKNGKLL